MTAYDLSIYAAKSIVVLLFLVFAYRLLGKRDTGQFNVYDLVTVIALSNAVQNAMTSGRGELGVGLSSATALLAVTYLLSRFFVRKPTAQRLAYGIPVILMSHGRIYRDRLKRERVSIEELESSIRSHGLSTHGSVAMAVLEVDGSISIIPKEGNHVVDKDFN
jgi:uncharacterized membrane protein YcaP (DUF421 family)